MTSRSVLGITIGLVATAAVVVTAQVDLSKAKLRNPAALNEQAPATYKARLDTTKGPFVVEVTRAEETQGRSITTTRAFGIRGGGRSRSFLEMSGDAPPEAQSGPLTPCTVTEAITVLAIGATAMADFLVPALAFPDDHSEAEEVPGLPRRTRLGADATGDERARG